MIVIVIEKVVVKGSAGYVARDSTKLSKQVEESITKRKDGFPCFLGKVQDNWKGIVRVIVTLLTTLF